MKALVYDGRPGTDHGSRRSHPSRCTPSSPIGRATLLAVSLIAAAGVSATSLLACLTVEDERIVFRASHRGGSDIYVMRPDGSEQRPVLESNSTIEWTPALSPDGKKIAFARTLRRRDPHSDIYVMGSDGSNVTRLTDHPSEEGFPTWSPDGLRIAFQAGVVGFPDPPWPTDGAARIHVINADGSNRTRLTENDAAETTPQWSPDGNSILFASDLGGNWDIYVIDADGTGQTRLTNDPGEDIMPIWSPDGTRVAFVSDRGGVLDIFLMELNGGEPERLTEDSGIWELSGMAWSPDGLSIAFGATRDRAADIYVVSLADGTENRLTTESGVDVSPSWGPPRRQPINP